MAPMKGDLNDPNKQQVINLMNVCSTIFNWILNNRLCKLLENYIIKNQFGATPGVGCADGVFTLKTLLHQLKQHNFKPYVVFADLVKAFDAVNHDILIKNIRTVWSPTQKSDWQSNECTHTSQSASPSRRKLLRSFRRLEYADVTTFCQHYLYSSCQYSANHFRPNGEKERSVQLNSWESWQMS